MITQDFLVVKKETLSSARCYQTYSFTIKDEKLKVQILGVSYEYSSLIFGTTSVNIVRSLRSLYPITASDQLEWKERLSLIVETDRRIKSLTSNLANYIKAFESDYDF